MILALTKDQGSRMRWEAGNGKANIYSVDGMFITENPEFDSAYILDEHNPKIKVFNTLEEAIEFIK
jgi:hypothetical protein